MENDFTNHYEIIGLGTFSIHLSNFNFVEAGHDELDDKPTAISE